tara:strand:+ start:1955 stop:3934 length:1980 start_codon:yes stop_codon:yes gene_type:complete
LKYRKDIDGLRALAIIPVLFFHTNLGFLDGGFVGVDLFFVISGYLITSIIYSQILNDQFSFVHFYERRFRRILPAFFFVVILTFPFAYKLLFTNNFIEYAESIIASTLFVANILFWKDSDYFDNAAELKPLLHTWSLSLEEQFYIIFPILLFILLKVFKNKNQVKFLILFFVVFSFFIDPIMRYVFSNKSSLASAIFYLLPSRAWQIGIGSICALFYTDFKCKYRNSNLFVTIGLIMITSSFFIFNKSTPWPSFYALLPTLGAALIIMQGEKSSIANNFLGNKLIVSIGKWSYSIYLIHLPLFVFCRYQFGEENLNILGYSVLIIFSILLAHLNYRFVESPFRDKNLINKKNIFKISLIFSLILLSIGFIIINSNGMPNRSINTKFKVAEYQADNKILEEDYWSLTDSIIGINTEKIDSRMEKADMLGNQFDWFKNSVDSKSNILIIGNSFSYDFFGVLFYSQSVRKNFLLGRYGAQVEDLDYNKLKTNINYIKSNILVFCSRYSNKDYKAISELVAAFLNDGKRVFLVKNIFEFEYNSLRNVADEIVQYEINRNNFSPEDISEKVNKRYYNLYHNNKNTRAEELISLEEKVFKSIKEKNPEVNIIDRMDYMIIKNKAYFIDKKLNKYSSDYGHHTLEGLKNYAKLIDSIKFVQNFTRH